MVGKILANRYEILEKIGGGGMAIVYKGRDNLLNRLVTIKVLRPEYTSDEEFVARFRKEAQAVASLSHPNIVSIYDVGQEESIHYLVMEYVDGENLKTVIKRTGPLPVAQAVKIAGQICDALEHAHGNNIVHRDVKPHNILITPLGRAKLTDFGIAMETSAGTVVNTETVIGSVYYLSPEQARGDLAGPRSDIYSLGVVLYEMLTGLVPFTGDTPVGVAIKHIQENPQPVNSVNPAIPPALAMVVARAMQKDPLMRYSSVGEMKEDLEPATHTGPGEETIIIRENLQPALAEGKHMKKRRVRPVAWVILLLLLAGLLTVSAVVLKNYLNVPEVRVPDVTGKTLPDARDILAQDGLQTEVVYGYNPSIVKGEVVSQDPVAGIIVKQDRTITLTVSQGPQMVSVPNVCNMMLDAARIALSQAGLNVGETKAVSSTTVPQGEVISQSPQPGTSVPQGENINLNYSGGQPQAVTVPDLTGLSLSQAGDKLSSVNLVLNQGNISYVPSGDYLSGQVVSQSPPANSTLAPGSPVAVTLSSGPGPPALQATVVVPVPSDGNSHLVRIVVQDVRGITEAFKATEQPGTTLKQPVIYYGSATISVYIDGTLSGQQTM